MMNHPRNALFLKNNLIFYTFFCPKDVMFSITPYRILSVLSFNQNRAYVVVTSKKHDLLDGLMRHC